MFSYAGPNDWAAAYKELSTGGHWSKEESLFHINILAMKAVSFVDNT